MTKYSKHSLEKEALKVGFMQKIIGSGKNAITSIGTLALLISFAMAFYFANKHGIDLSKDLMGIIHTIIGALLIHHGFKGKDDK